MTVINIDTLFDSNEPDITFHKLIDKFNYLRCRPTEP